MQLPLIIPSHYRKHINMATTSKFNWLVTAITILAVVNLVFLGYIWLQKKEGTNGVDIYKLKGWDYAGMCEIIEHAVQKIRDTHIPALFHVEEITQPQGHSTSGSHERYKKPERLAWEREWDCIRKMREWILANSLADEQELSDIEVTTKLHVKDSKNKAWEKFITPVKQQIEDCLPLLQDAGKNAGEVGSAAILQIAEELANDKEPIRREVMKKLSAALDIAGNTASAAALQSFHDELKIDFFLICSIWNNRFVYRLAKNFIYLHLN